eukprot:TRINITY_DN5382_c0_g1_i2.p1 TRINITY_DN5382_c0_g1~~TRINITY_DN5382_c0_g1_i2.p1  ORF type:complete len:154 (-),score=35.03 TRINITY_DN5382_c0_g1_i2:108-569(-)
MQRLVSAATSMSGIPEDEAFSIDQGTSVYEMIGHDAFVKLSTEFYGRVYSDDEAPWFKQIFAGSEKADAIQNQYEFFSQRMGGPPLFSQRKGHPALIGRHKNFPVTKETADRWLHHMRAAFDATPEIDPESRRRMLNYLTHTAYFLVAGQNRD